MLDGLLPAQLHTHLSRLPLTLPLLEIPSIFLRPSSLRRILINFVNNVVLRAHTGGLYWELKWLLWIDLFASVPVMQLRMTLRLPKNAPLLLNGTPIFLRAREL